MSADDTKTDVSTAAAKGSAESVTHAARDAASERAIRRRSIAIALALVGMVILFYAATFIRLGANVANRTM